MSSRGYVWRRLLSGYWPVMAASIALAAGNGSACICSDDLAYLPPSSYGNRVFIGNQLRCARRCDERQRKTRLAGAFAWFWLPPRDSRALQIRDLCTFSTAIPSKIPYAEKGIHTPIPMALSRTFSGYYGRSLRQHLPLPGETQFELRSQQRLPNSRCQFLSIVEAN